MSGRSTRKKLKFQADKAIADMGRAQDHLSYLAAVCDDRSDYVEKFLPVIMALIEETIKMVKLFREGL